MAKAPSKPTQKSVTKGKVAPKAATVSKTRRAATASAKKTLAAKTLTSSKKKPVSVTKTVSKKKTVATSVKKSVAPRKTSVKVKPAKAKSVKTAAPQAKAARTSLQAKLDSVANRLSTADRRTKKNIATLEIDFDALSKQVGRTKAGHTRLTRRVTELSKTLSQDLQNAQTEIRRDLAAVLQNPSVDSLQAALSRAESRLEESEQAQDVAIARINRHISDIATIVEQRLSEESQARIDAMAEMKREMSVGQSQILAAKAEIEKSQTLQAEAMTLRFTNLQSESADAIRSLGDKIVDVAEEMGRRRETLGTNLRQEFNESTLTAATEFEQFRRVVERRLEALETELRDVDGRIDRTMAPLASRVEGLEYGLTQRPEPHIGDFAPGLQAVPPLTTASPLSAPVTENTNLPTPQVLEPDAFSPEPPAAYPVAQEAPLDLTEPAPAKAVPYDPSMFAAAPAQVPVQAPVQAPIEAPVPAQLPYAQAGPAAALAADPYAQTGQPANPYDTAPLAQYAPEPAHQEPSYSTAQPPFPQPAAFDPAQPHIAAQAGQADDLAVIEGELPYADPAYAEGGFDAPHADAIRQSDDSMSAARPGAIHNLKKIGRKTRAKDTEASKRLVTPRNLKLGALVAALGIVSVLGVQKLMPKDGPAGEFSVANNAALDASTLPNGRPSLEGPNGQILSPNGNVMPPANQMSADAAAVLTPGNEQPTIGQYADNRKMAMAEGGESALSAAVQAGDPIAQLQMGLSKLENGDVDMGVKLIRASANQDQPAALYRLAKIYETGQGVGKDAKTARQLTERAARGGNRIAMHDLALYYAEPGGRGGVDMDMPTAAKWFEKAAERDVVDSQFNLGILFESGQGLPQDLESALVWYSIAGAQGDQMAAGRVGVLRQTLSEDQVERADNRIAAFSPSRIDEQANGIFNNVPWAKPSQVAAVSAAKAGVVQTQTLLNELGYDVGAADGAIGPKTKNAIQSFQRLNGFEETGTVNAKLIEQLESAADA